MLGVRQERGNDYYSMMKTWTGGESCTVEEGQDESKSTKRDGKLTRGAK